jgi:YihY family inner membrane protein
MHPPAIVARILGRPIVVTLLRVFDVYGRAPGGLLANGLAFTALFAIAPIALVTLGIAGIIVDDPVVQEQIGDALASVFPPAKDLIDSVLAQLTQGAAATSIIGVIGLLWTVSQFYVTLDIAFSRIYSDQPRRDMVVRTARGFAWVAGLVGLVVALIVIASLTTAAEALIPASSTAFTVVGRIVTSPPTVILAVIAVVLVIYVVLPPDAPHWRLALVPAAAAGLAIYVLAQLFLFAAPRLVGAAALAGALATAFIALAWLSFTFQALLLGASWVRVRMDEERARSALAGPAAPAEPGVGRE